MAGAALDPLAELWVFVFANNGDFDAYRPRLARYLRGVTTTPFWPRWKPRSGGARRGWPSWGRRR